jgi:hypothetical protein
VAYYHAAGGTTWRLAFEKTKGEVAAEPMANQGTARTSPLAHLGDPLEN